MQQRESRWTVNWMNGKLEKEQGATKGERVDGELEKEQGAAERADGW